MFLALTGTLPETLSNLSRLIYLDVNSNLLHGSLPDSFRALEALDTINVGGNSLSGSVPQSWSSMRRMKKAAFFNNTGLNGCLPASWQAQSDYFLDKQKMVEWVLTGTNITGLCSA